METYSDLRRAICQPQFQPHQPVHIFTHKHQGKLHSRYSLPQIIHGQVGPSAYQFCIFDTEYLVELGICLFKWTSPAKLSLTSRVHAELDKSLQSGRTYSGVSEGYEAQGALTYNHVQEDSLNLRAYAKRVWQGAPCPCPRLFRHHWSFRTCAIVFLRQN